MISRRRLLAAGMAVPFGVGIASGDVFAQTGIQPKIGDPQASFDAWFGAGFPSGGFIYYPPVAVGRASYNVQFDEQGFAQTIVGDFHDLDGGGIPHAYLDTHEVGQSQFVPVDAVEGPVAQFGSGLHEFGVIGVRGWSRTAGPPAGSVIVLDRFVRDMMMGAMRFKETIVTTASDPIHLIVTTGTHLGPHSTSEAWKQYPGGVLMHQSGFDLVTPPVPGMWTIFGQRADIIVQLDQSLPMEEAARLIGSMLPDADVEWSGWIPATPITSWQLRLHQFRAYETGDRFLTAQFVDGDEVDGMVTRFDLVRAIHA